MKVLTLLVLCAAVAASADDKAGRLFNAFKGKADAPAPAAHTAVVPAVAPAAPTAAAPAPVTAAGQAAPQVDAAVSAAVDAAAVEPTPVVAVEATDASASPLPALLSLAQSWFGANPTARDLRRPIVVSAKSMEEDGAPAAVEGADSPLPPRRGGGLLGAVCGGILDALFGAPPAPVVPEAPAPDASAVMTPGGWFNFRPSAFFQSFMGPLMGPPAPLPAPVSDADATDATDATAVPLGTPVVTVVSSVSTTDENGNTESEVTVLPPRPSASLLVPDAGMHRVGGSARVGKLFNRVMRFLNLRPRPDMAAPNAAADDSDDNASDDDQVPPTEEDDDTTAEDEQPSAEDDDEADEADAGEWHTGHGHGHGRGHRWLRWLKRKARNAARKAAKWFGRHAWRHGGWRHGRWGRQHRACKEDVARLCPNAKEEGGFTAVVQCMARHKDELSGQCLSHVQYSSAFNCADDAARLCPDARSRHALKRCLKRQRDSVSEQCKAAVRAHRKWWKRAAAEDDDDTADVTATADDAANDNSAVEYVDADVLTSDAATQTAAPTAAPVVPSAADVLKQQQQMELQLPAQERLVIGLTETDAAAAGAPLQAAPMHAVRRGPALMEAKEQSGAANSGAAKPSVSARVSAWVSGAAASASAHAKRLPQWAVVLIAVVAALAVVGAVSACVVVARRRRAARLAAAEPKQPLLSAAPGAPGAPHVAPHVQITALPARSARRAAVAAAPEVAAPAPAPLTAAAAVAAVAEPIAPVTVTVAAV